MNKKTGKILMLLIFAMTAVIFVSCQRQNLSATEDGIHENEQSTGENENLRYIVYMYPWMGAIPSGVDDVEERINVITEEKINTHVTLRPVSYSTFSQQMALVLAEGEKVDLVTIPDDFLNMLAEDQLMDMTDYLNDYGQGVLDAVGTFLSGTMRDGRIYGVTAMGGKATSTHFLMRTDWLLETGIDTGQITPAKGIFPTDKSLDTVESIFASVKEKHPNAQILVSSIGETNLKYLICYDSMGDSFGVIMNGDNYKVVNLYESEEYRKVVEMAIRWNGLGYIMDDASVNTAASSDVLMTGNAFCDLVMTQQGVEAQYKQSTGYDFTAVQMNLPMLYTGQNLLTVNSLPICCQEPEAAVEFLNLMYTDAQVVNLLAYGVEGLHYRFMPDGTVDYPEGMTGQNSPYPCIQTWMFGNTLLDYVKVGNVPDLYEIQARANDTARRSTAFGFIYDNTSVLSQVTACERIVEQYEPGLLTGELDIKMLDEFNNKLEDAGINQIIQEKQRQLDEWLEENQIETDS